jgi:hypothetical protein
MHERRVMLSGGSKSINIVSSDTGVAVFDDLNMDHLWMIFGKGKDLRWIPIHDIVRSLGPRSKELPFFHAFTGCDTVSACCLREKGQGARHLLY